MRLAREQRPATSGPSAQRPQREAAVGRSRVARRPSRAEVHRAARRRGAAARDHVHLQPGRLRGRRPAVPARRACGCTTPEERARGPRDRRGALRRHPDEDLHVLGYYEWLDGLERGIAAHHAGMLPTFKEVVEELFVRGLVKAVFATETLALGINMPARSVVLEKLVKWNGESHADITPGEYTQLTGRAGRRGIDVEGHAVVLWQPGLDPRRSPGSPAPAPIRCARASGRRTTWPSTWSASSAGTARASCWRRRSRSSRPTGRSSGLARQVARNEEGLEGYREAMTCHLGDFEEYAAAAPRAHGPRDRAVPQGAAKRRARPPRRWRSCSPATSSTCRPAAAAALAGRARPGPTAAGRGRAAPAGADRRAAGKRLSLVDFPVPVEPLDRMRIPKSFNPRSPPAAATSPPTLRNTGRAIGRRRRTPRPRSAAADDARSPGCAPSSAATPATAAPTARTTPAGPSATTGCRATPSSWSGGSRAAPTPSPAPSTGSARCSPSSATCAATR